VEEARSLYTRGDLAASLPALRTVGYRQVLQYLIGEVEYSEMVERGIYATRQLARRQLTWLRREPGLAWFDSTQEGYEKEVIALLSRRFGGGGPGGRAAEH
jgi:tRNA dimethylallyltransferase